MDRTQVILLVLLAAMPVFITSSRFLVGDEVSEGGGQIDNSNKTLTLPPESTSPKDPPSKTEKQPSLTSLRSESQNQSQLDPPVPSQLEKNTTPESSSPGKSDQQNKQDINNTLLSSPETSKPVNGTETGTDNKKEGQIGNFKQGLCDDMASERCYDESKKWVACLQFPSNDQKELFLVIENKEENEISLDINSTPSLILDTKKIPVPKFDSLKVKIIKSDSNKAGNITISAGKGECILHITPSKTLINDWQKSFQQFTNFASTQFSPIYGLYLFILTLVISLITFACCKFTRGRKRNGESSYQQLEMGESQPGASSAVAEVADSADGWERGWDDDWDEEEAVIGNGSSVNNPSSKVTTTTTTTNSNSKDGWDVDWDD